MQSIRNLDGGHGPCNLNDTVNELLSLCGQISMLNTFLVQHAWLIDEYARADPEDQAMYDMELFFMLRQVLP